MSKHIIRLSLSSALALTFCCLLILPSCGKKSERTSAETETIVATAEGQPADTIAEEIKPEPEPKKWFADANDALEYMRNSGHWDNYEKGILPQMAKDELKYTTRLLNNEHDGFIVVDKARMKVIRFNKYGEEVVSYGMACARNFGTKHEKPDNRTPEGFFSVRKVYDSTEWQFVDDDGKKSDKKGEFGPRFIRLNIPGWYSIGIHGTCAPWSIGGRRSHGCIRVTNENIMQLIEMVDSGMPVIVTPGRKDMMVNLEEGYEIPAISTIPGKPAPKLSEAAKKEALRNRDLKKQATDTIKISQIDTLENKTEKIINEEKMMTQESPDSVATGVTQEEKP